MDLLKLYILLKHSWKKQYLWWNCRKVFISYIPPVILKSIFRLCSVIEGGIWINVILFLSTELPEQDCASILGHWSVLKGSVRNRPGRATQAKCQYYLLLEQGIYAFFPLQRQVSRKSRFMLFLCFEDPILYLEDVVFQSLWLL